MKSLQYVDSFMNVPRGINLQRKAPLPNVRLPDLLQAQQHTVPCQSLPIRSSGAREEHLKNWVYCQGASVDLKPHVLVSVVGRGRRSEY